MSPSTCKIRSLVGAFLCVRHRQKYSLGRLALMIYCLDTERGSRARHIESCLGHQRELFDSKLAGNEVRLANDYS